MNGREGKRIHIDESKEFRYRVYIKICYSSRKLSGNRMLKKSKNVVWCLTMYDLVRHNTQKVQAPGQIYLKQKKD